MRPKILPATRTLVAHPIHRLEEYLSEKYSRYDSEYSELKKNIRGRFQIFSEYENNIRGRCLDRVISFAVRAG